MTAILGYPEGSAFTTPLNLAVTQLDRETMLAVLNHTEAQWRERVSNNPANPRGDDPQFTEAEAEALSAAIGICPFGPSMGKRRIPPEAFRPTIQTDLFGPACDEP